MPKRTEKRPAKPRGQIGEDQGEEKEPYVTTGLRIPERQLKRLRRIALARANDPEIGGRVSVSNVLTAMLERYLPQMEKELGLREG